MVLKQAKTIQSGPEKNIRKVDKKEQNEANCTNLFTCNCKITTDKLFQMLYFTWTKFQHRPSSLRAVKYNFNVPVNSQMQCSHVIQTQAQKCDGMHINVDAIYQGGTKFAHKTSKTQTAFIGSIFSDERNPPFWSADAQFILLRILRSSKYVKLIYVFGSAYVKIGVWIKVGPQPLFSAEPGMKNGWAGPNYTSHFKLIHMVYFTGTKESLPVRIKQSWKSTQKSKFWNFVRIKPIISLIGFSPEQEKFIKGCVCFKGAFFAVKIDKK